MAKKAPPKTHKRRPNGRAVCGTQNPKALFVQDIGDTTCKTCQSRYEDQRREGTYALKSVVQTGALTEEEMVEILQTAIREEAVKQVMEG